jgi:molybdate-binding protein
VAIGEVRGSWVAHRLPADASIAADGLVAGGERGRTAVVRPLADPGVLRRNILIAGCAPLLGALARHVGDRSGGARATWLEEGSARALDLLRGGFVHVAGIHGGIGSSQEDNEAVARRALPGTRALLVGFTRWRLGLVVPARNPREIQVGADLLRPGLRLARREPGTGADKLAMSLLAAEGAGNRVLVGPLASGHAEVAQLVRCGAADVGIAIEGVALAAGLGFVPLVEEGFDLVVPAELADSPPVVHLLDALDDPSFRADAGELPGYDIETCGHVRTLEAA